MPVDKTPIVRRDEPPTKEKRKEQIVDFYISEPKFDMDDVILSESIKKEVKRIISYLKYHDKIFQEWNLQSVIKQHNLSVNFYGESGTGKTMTAHAIAKMLGKKMVIVNYAEIESKYVGETSKNLVSLFRFAQENDAIILFDEADALLSKRVTAMYSATDVSVNQTRNTLLKILDDYDGIIFFTTNFIQNFDSAFIRRIFCHVKFDIPNKATRYLLWEHYLLKTIPCEDRQTIIENISEVDGVTGADISIAVLKASIDAACGKDCITYELLKNTLEETLNAKKAVDGNYQITTRKVSEEYALSQINKGGTKDGVN
ncbi:ATP-binding protein [bacterium]|nr:ATP-binding protein [bacterium]